MDTDLHLLYDTIFNDLSKLIDNQYRTNADGTSEQGDNSEQALTQARHGSIKIEDATHLKSLIGSDTIQHYLEIGSYIGVSFRIINELFNPKNSYSIDPNIPHRVYHTPRNIFYPLNQKYKEKTTVIDSFWSGGGEPLVDASFFQSKQIQFDLIFIDGLHDYDSVKRDFNEAVKILSPNGVILLHDIYTWQDVGRFVTEIDNNMAFTTDFSPRKGAIDGFAAVRINHDAKNY